jgi:predicted nucleotidyltransferase
MYGMDPDRLAVVCRTHGVRLMLQFGSTVSGREHEASDVDLAVLLERRPGSLDAHVDLVGDLQTLVPGRDVDVALINGADPLFLRKITERCQLLYGSPRALHELKIYAFKRYQDHRRFLAMERAYVSGRIRALAR